MRKSSSGTAAGSGMSKPRPRRDAQSDKHATLGGKSNITALTKANQVYSDLRDRIMSGDLPPGRRLVIGRIAEQHGISDIPVREALRLLEKGNLIHYHPYGSAFVREVSDSEVYEVFFIRGLLEGAATQLCVNFLTEVTLRKLEFLCQRMEQFSREKDIREYSEHNREFHRTIFNALPFKTLIYQIEDLWQSYGWPQLTFRFQPGRMAESNAEHRQIVNALREGSVVAAGRAAFVHKQNARKAYMAARNRIARKSGSLSAASDPVVEGIELLCDIWQETQWPAGKKTAARAAQASMRALALRAAARSQTIDRGPKRPSRRGMRSAKAG